MARYTMDYTNDLGIVHQLVSLRVYRVDADEDFSTSLDEDADYLPVVFSQAIRPNRAVCTIPGRTRTIRQAVVQVTGSSFWVIPCPFPAGSEVFQAFFTDLNQRFSRVLLLGERVDRSYLRPYVGLGF
ncbi:MAG: hypothetical protein HC924_17505 [Synechococcaceae cyanobacterium SM2_3_2]|nr:hypothetical protein [Synechococcaceae cyanobacterium SM2_3_2]